MSDSDSDLDYASADEESSYEPNIKNNNDCLGIHPEHSKIKSSPLNEFNNELSCKNDIEKDILNEDDTQHMVTHDSDTFDLENKLSSEEQCDDDVLSEKFALSTLEEKNIKHDTNDSEGSKNIPLDTPLKDESSTNKTVEDSQSESGQNKVQEKQRIPLRLEKKIQQKQQIFRENSVKSYETKSDIPPAKQEVKSTSWGFGSWGTNLLSSAASSVSTFTNQVSQGIGTVFETVENTLGAPPPEDLASALKNRRESNDSPVNEVDEKDNSNIESPEENVSEGKSSILPNVIPNVSLWTKVLEDTGSKVLMGGLDTLELIGKKTIDIITEGDPGLRKKRSAFTDGTTLSQMLHEAKAEASSHADDPEKDTIYYSEMFDEYQGFVHLEALEMLSEQSEAKMKRLLIKISRKSELRDNLEEIKSICASIPQFDESVAYEDHEDFLTLCKKYVLELNLTFNIESIIKTQKKISDVLDNYENATVTTSTPKEIYNSAICSLAEFTAKCIEAFHKLAELILVQPSLESNIETFATNLAGLTKVMCIEINQMSSRYHHCLDSISEQCDNGNSVKANTTIVTNLYLEAGNSNLYIKEAFRLLVVVLQAHFLESS